MMKCTAGWRASLNRVQNDKLADSYCLMSIISEDISVAGGLVFCKKSMAGIKSAIALFGMIYFFVSN